MLTEYAMGKWGEIVPEGVCRTIPANAEVAWDIHMFPGGLGAMAPGSVIQRQRGRDWSLVIQRRGKPRIEIQTRLEFVSPRRPGRYSYPTQWLLHDTRLPQF